MGVGVDVDWGENLGKDSQLASSVDLCIDLGLDLDSALALYSHFYDTHLDQAERARLSLYLYQRLGLDTYLELSSRFMQKKSAVSGSVLPPLTAGTLKERAAAGALSKSSKRVREPGATNPPKLRSAKKSSHLPGDTAFKKSEIVPVDSPADMIPEEDLKLFTGHVDVDLGVVSFLFRFKKKYLSFKKLFERNHMGVTPYEILQRSGIVFVQLMDVLRASGGYKNLDALQVSTLQQLQAAGFEALHMIKILSKAGGYKNLKALQKLTIQEEGQDQTVLQQLQILGLKPNHLVRILIGHGGHYNLIGLLNFIPHCSGLTPLEKTAFLNFVSRNSTAAKFELAQKLIKLHGDRIDKVSLFYFLKNATNKLMAGLEALPLQQVVEKIQSKTVTRLSRKSAVSQVRPAVIAAPTLQSTHPCVVGAFSGVAGVEQGQVAAAGVTPV
jgi:hypothetical protein